MQKTLLVAAIAFGILIGYMDSRPSFDDTGITAGVILLTTAVLGAVAPARPWVWALAVGVWVPLFEIYAASNYGSLLALAFAFAGAYAGMVARRVLIAS
jgi:uncharacterized membrane protein (DUF441 family)